MKCLTWDVSHVFALDIYCTSEEIGWVCSTERNGHGQRFSIFTSIWHDMLFTMINAYTYRECEAEEEGVRSSSVGVNSSECDVCLKGNSVRVYVYVERKKKYHVYGWDV